jgi:hypothetical protein
MAMYQLQSLVLSGINRLSHLVSLEGLEGSGSSSFFRCYPGIRLETEKNYEKLQSVLSGLPTLNWVITTAAAISSSYLGILFVLWVSSCCQ